jgi:hypothetical protein
MRARAPRVATTHVIGRGPHLPAMGRNGALVDDHWSPLEFRQAEHVRRVCAVVTGSLCQGARSTASGRPKCRSGARKVARERRRA